MSCISDKLVIFSVYEFLKFHQCAILCCTSGSYNTVSICHIYTYINIHPPHTHTHTHTHTQTEAHTRTHARFKFFNENIRVLCIINDLFQFGL